MVVLYQFMGQEVVIRNAPSLYKGSLIMADEKRQDLLQSVSYDLCSTFIGDMAVGNESEMSHFRGILNPRNHSYCSNIDLQKYSRLEEL